MHLFVCTIIVSTLSESIVMQLNSENIYIQTKVSGVFNTAQSLFFCVIFYMTYVFETKTAINNNEKIRLIRCVFGVNRLSKIP